MNRLCQYKHAGMQFIFVRARSEKLHAFESVKVICTYYFFLNMRTTDKIHVRFYIKTRDTLNNPASEIHRELCEVYGTSIVSFSTVCRWLSKLKNGTNVINDAARSGRSKTATTKVNIAAVKRLVDGRQRLYMEIHGQCYRCLFRKGTGNSDQKLDA